MLSFQVLDKRHKGHGTFTYRVQIKGTQKLATLEEFHKVRVWCWETFGPSTEREAYLGTNLNSGWSWYVDSDSHYYAAYIYLAHGNPESLFKLKWM